MAPPKRPWFRLYVELIWDRKLRRLPEKSRWLFIAMLACARQSPLPGFLMLDDKAPMDWDDLCDAASMKLRDVEKGTDQLQDVGIIDFDQNLGAWCIPKWDDRQFESDETTKRTAKHRSKERRRNVPTLPDETPQKSEADSEPESESETPTASSPPAEDDRFEEFWKRYPKRDGKRLGKGPTHTVWKRLSKAKREAAFTGIDNYRQACEEGITKAKDPIRWLRGQVWDDWQTPAEPDVEKPRTNGSKWEDARLTAPAPYREQPRQVEPDPRCEHSDPICEACKKANLERLHRDMKAVGLR